VSGTLRKRGRAWRSRGRARAGFTLVELTVALLAGLIVAIAIVGLSKEATRTFHEEVRSSSAEAALRTAVDRLRADLARASYMSTPNIQTDPMITHAPGAANVATALATTYPGIAALAGIRLYEGTATQNTANGVALLSNANANPGIAPDMIDIGGNMTSAEQFEVQAIQPGAVGSCTRILLSATSPAIFRILSNNTSDAGAANASADAEMRNLFQPVSAAASTQFIVRIVDDTGRSQFLATCPGQTNASGLGGGPPLAPFVLVDGTPLTAATTQGMSGLTGNAAGRAWVNPVQVVRWEVIGPSGADGQPAQDVAALNNVWTEAGGTEPAKYDLMRSYIDAKGVVVDASREIVAEYAVDFDVAFSVDTTIDVTGATPNIVTYDFDDTNVQKAGDTVTVVTANPQRIRAVRARLVTRTAQADRSVNIPAAEGGVPFIYRYCLTTAGCSGSTALQWARARTVTTEVSLPNQSRSFF